MYRPRTRNFDSTIKGLFGGIHQFFLEAALDLLYLADVPQNERKRIQVDLAKIAFMLLNLSGRLIVGFRTQVRFDFLLELAKPGWWPAPIMAGSRCGMLQRAST
jgi:hypothetical protein